jgi:TetR/AcrR family tetracycline transcriptional repressor
MGGSMALNRDEIVRAALELLDRVGLDRLSLRGLAEQLGVQAPTLYWHFENKQALLDEMAGSLMNGMDAEEPPGGEQTWEGWLSWLARRMRRAMLSRRDGALLTLRASPYAQQWAALEFIADALVRNGFKPEEALGGIGALMSYVLGATLTQQQAAAGSSSWGDIEKHVGESEHPTLARAIAADPGFGYDQQFEHGLAVVLLGIRSMLKSAAR